MEKVRCNIQSSYTSKAFHYKKCVKITPEYRGKLPLSDFEQILELEKLVTIDLKNFMKVSDNDELLEDLSREQWKNNYDTRILTKH